MQPAGYMAKRVGDDLVSSVASCGCPDFADFIPHWRHNGYWFFDSPAILAEVAAVTGSDLTETQIFYYEVHEFEYSSETRSWTNFGPDFAVAVEPPAAKSLLGYDVATFWARNAPEHSPLSCNGLSKEIPVNARCLLEDFDTARKFLEAGAFDGAEPGPYRIFAVYSFSG